MRKFTFFMILATSLLSVSGASPNQHRDDRAAVFSVNDQDIGSNYIMLPEAIVYSALAADCSFVEAVTDATADVYLIQSTPVEFVAIERLVSNNRRIPAKPNDHINKKLTDVVNKPFEADLIWPIKERVRNVYSN